MSRPVSPLHDLLAKAPKASEDFQIAMDETSPYQTYDGTKQNESQFLEPPQHRAPHRPLSPDTLSNLSAEEFDQLGPRNDEPSVWLDGGHQALKPSWTAKWQAKLRASWTRNAGLFYMLLAQVFGVMMNVTTRLLEIEGNKGKGLHPFQILFARMSITVVLSSLYMWYTKTPHFPLGNREVRWLLVARGLGGFWGVFGMYYSLIYLPLADATVITFLAPSLTCWVCSFLLKEPFTKIDKIGSLISLVGVVFIARPTSLFFSSADAPPASGNTDVVSGANSTVTIPDASNYDNRAHPLISVNYFATWCTIVSIVAQLTLPGIGFLLPADAKEWGYLLFLGTCGFIMQFLLAAGLSYEKSSRATNMAYTSMLFALGFDRFIFGQTPGATSIIGSTLILGSAIYMAMQRDKGGSARANNETRTGVGQNRDEEEGLMRGADEGDEEIIDRGQESIIEMEPIEARR
ncbi:hypothetical protein M438DRAFT_398227 [Aureobasidium pullulans EXF-150]|uniref:EamA domain-containing protein n=1 Tax=Aureobasidium pullulans EXF-150 TaxID=1043002 RepID=A0A074XBC6_AURPU|nr:uncharacterized protein M438DRAFT_398227 [Aureobasidium pullulans EXF-150]KEQ82638.1 hypothetical protein M438DRAFT_398227 [Aureobasidium pullulans EXF-150]